eukprot:4412158-Pyramimonas_sp.AAC.1
MTGELRGRGYSNIVGASWVYTGPLPPHPPLPPPPLGKHVLNNNRDGIVGPKRSRIGRHRIGKSESGCI